MVNAVPAQVYIGTIHGVIYMQPDPHQNACNVALRSAQPLVEYCNLLGCQRCAVGESAATLGFLLENRRARPHGASVASSALTDSAHHFSMNKSTQSATIQYALPFTMSANAYLAGGWEEISRHAVASLTKLVPEHAPVDALKEAKVLS